MFDEESFREVLRQAAGHDITVVFTDNSSSLISLRRRGSAQSVRIHRLFLNSDACIMEELAAFIRGVKGKTPLIREFIRKNSHLLKKSATRVSTPKTEGRFHDLLAIFGSVNAEYFKSKISSRITWGTGRQKRVVRRRTLGSYSACTDTIRINAILDRRDVPRYFVEFIVYHEMLHADMGAEKNNGRRTVHSQEFRRREKEFKKYGKALSWERRWARR